MSQVLRCNDKVEGMNTLNTPFEDLFVIYFLEESLALLETKWNIA